MLTIGKVGSHSGFNEAGAIMPRSGAPARFPYGAIAALQ